MNFVILAPNSVFKGLNNGKAVSVQNKVLVNIYLSIVPKSCCLSIVAAINAKLKEFVKVEFCFCHS
jgi:hypothetical protein